MAIPFGWSVAAPRKWIKKDDDDDEEEEEEEERGTRVKQHLQGHEVTSSFSRCKTSQVNNPLKPR